MMEAGRRVKSMDKRMERGGKEWIKRMERGGKEWIKRMERRGGRNG